MKEGPGATQPGVQTPEHSYTHYLSLSLFLANTHKHTYTHEHTNTFNL